MAEENKDNLESEKQDGGGETDKQKTTGKSAEELAKIADDQRKRAEIAEAENKELKAKIPKDKPIEPVKEPNPINVQQSDPVELAKMANVLQGLSDKEIEELQAVAAAKKLSLAEAKKDPLFQAWHTKFLEDARKEANKRGASRGSNQDSEDSNEPVFKPGMTRAEHEAAVKQMMAK